MYETTKKNKLLSVCQVSWFINYYTGTQNISSRRLLRCPGLSYHAGHNEHQLGSKIHYTLTSLLRLDVQSRNRPPFLRHVSSSPPVDGRQSRLVGLGIPSCHKTLRFIRIRLHWRNFRAFSLRFSTLLPRSKYRPR